MIIKRTLIAVLALVTLFAAVGVAGAQDPIEVRPQIERDGTRLLHLTVARHVVDATGVEARELIEARMNGQSYAEFVTASGGDPIAVAAEVVADVTNHINEAVANGRLEQDRADEMLAELPITVDEIMNSTEPLELPRQDRRDDRRDQREDRARRVVIDVVADSLGLEPGDIRQELVAGKSLNEIIIENGGDVETIKQLVIDTITTTVNEALAEGKITAEQAARLLENLEERIDHLFDFQHEGRAPRNS